MLALVVTCVPEVENGTRVYLEDGISDDEFIMKAKQMYHRNLEIEKAGGYVNESKSRWNDYKWCGEIVYADNSKLIYDVSYVAELE